MENLQFEEYVGGHKQFRIPIDKARITPKQDITIPKAFFRQKKIPMTSGYTLQYAQDEHNHYIGIRFEPTKKRSGSNTYSLLGLRKHKKIQLLPGDYPLMQQDDFYYIKIPKINPTHTTPS